MKRGTLIDWHCSRACTYNVARVGRVTYTITATENKRRRLGWEWRLCTTRTVLARDHINGGRKTTNRQRVWARTYRHPALARAAVLRLANSGHLPAAGWHYSKPGSRNTDTLLTDLAVEFTRTAATSEWLAHLWCEPLADARRRLAGHPVPWAPKHSEPFIADTFFPPTTKGMRNADK